MVRTNRGPEALRRADVRRCGTLWYAETLQELETLPRLDGVNIRTVQASDAKALRVAMVAAEADQPELAEIRLRGQRLGYIAEAAASEGASAGDVLSYGWIARKGDTVNDLGFTLELPSTEGWIYDCATTPEARGRGIYVALLMTMRAEFGKYGLERGWIGTAPANWPSQRGIARARFHKAADMDWRGEIAIMYGVPGVSQSALSLLAEAMGDGNAEIVPNAGIPWIEAILTSPDGQCLATEPEGLRRFRQVYAEQIHWTTRMTGPQDDGTVTLQAADQHIRVPVTASFEQYAVALDALAPKMPLLGESD